eukprot:1401228-Rhodomonas_salina.2
MAHVRVRVRPGWSGAERSAARNQRQETTSLARFVLRLGLRAFDFGLQAARDQLRPLAPAKQTHAPRPDSALTETIPASPAASQKKRKHKREKQHMRKKITGKETT